MIKDPEESQRESNIFGAETRELPVYQEIFCSLALWGFSTLNYQQPSRSLFSAHHVKMTDQARSLTASKRKRGVVRASVTKLGTKLGELEANPDNPTTIDHAKCLNAKLESLDAEFKDHHYSVVELITHDEELEGEQEIIDRHDDVIADLKVRVQNLISICSHRSKDPSAPRNLQARKLERLEREVSGVKATISSLSEESDNTCLLQLNQEKLADFQRELTGIRDSLFAFGLDNTDKLMGAHSEIEKEVFQCSLSIRQCLQSVKVSTASARAITSDGSGVKLPKLDVPRFGGNILEWQSFWEQFRTSVHDRSHLNNSEKLVYLRQALKDGTARSAIEGLSRSGEHYEEAVDYLLERFDRPRLIHQTHVREIVETPCLKDGSGKELRRFHDVMQQHIRALKAMSYEPPDGIWLCYWLNNELSQTAMLTKTQYCAL